MTIESTRDKALYIGLTGGCLVGGVAGYKLWNAMGNAMPAMEEAVQQAEKAHADYKLIMTSGHPRAEAKLSELSAEWQKASRNFNSARVQRPVLAILVGVLVSVLTTVAIGSTIMGVTKAFEKKSN